MKKEEKDENPFEDFKYALFKAKVGLSLSRIYQFSILNLRL